MGNRQQSMKKREGRRAAERRREREGDIPEDDGPSIEATRRSRAPSEEEDDSENTRLGLDEVSELTPAPRVRRGRAPTSTEDDLSAAWVATDDAEATQPGSPPPPAPLGGG